MPSIGVFCVHDPIPFHLQLSKPGGIVYPPLDSIAPPLVKVRILRDIAMNAGDRNFRRSITLGEGTVQVLPQSPQETLNWEGEACCRDPASVVGTFSCGVAAITVCFHLIHKFWTLCSLPTNFEGYTGGGNITTTWECVSSPESLLRLSD